MREGVVLYNPIINCRQRDSEGPAANGPGGRAAEPEYLNTAAAGPRPRRCHAGCEAAGRAPQETRKKGEVTRMRSLSQVSEPEGGRMEWAAVVWEEGGGELERLVTGPGDIWKVGSDWHVI